MAGYYGGYSGAGGGYGKPNGIVTPPSKSINPYQYAGATHARSNSSIADIDQLPNVFNKEYNISSRSSKANKQHRGHSRRNIVTPPPSSSRGGGRRGVTPPPLVHATSACERRREVAPPPSHSRSRVPSACGGRRGGTPSLPPHSRVPSVCGRSAATGVCARKIGTHATAAVGALQEPCWDNHDHGCECFSEWLKHFNHDFCSHANTPLKSFNNPCWNCGALPMIPGSSGIPFGFNGINDPAANGGYGNRSRSRSRNRTPGAHGHYHPPSQSTIADINQLNKAFSGKCNIGEPAFNHFNPPSYYSPFETNSCNPYRHTGGACYAPSKSFIADVQKLPDVFSRDFDTNIYSVHTCRSGENSPTSGVATAKSFSDLTARNARSRMNAQIPPGTYPVVGLAPNSTPYGACPLNSLHHHHVAGYGNPPGNYSSGYSNASSINPYLNAGVGRYIPSQVSMADIHQLPNVFCENYINVPPAFTQVHTPSYPSPYTSGSDLSGKSMR